MAKQPRYLNGKVVAITGGARGIGLATARAIAREGGKVALGDLNGDGAAAAAETLGPNAIGLSVDVTDRDSFEAFIDAVEERLGPVDVVINNAGIMLLGDFMDEDPERARSQFDVNVWGVWHGTQIAMRRMRPRGTGHIVNIASMAGKTGFPGGATYCATKHAVVGLSEAVRGELRKTGVEVSVVMPSIVNTDLGSGLVEARFVKNINPEDVAQEIVDALKFPRFDVFVPRSNQGVTRLTAVLPRRASEAVGRAFKADQVLAGANTQVRLDYERQAAQRRLEAGEGGESGADGPAPETGEKETAES